MSTPPFLGHAPPVRSTVQHSWGLTYEGDHHLEQRYHTSAPGCGSATVDGWESQCLESWIRDGYSVSIFEALQLPSCPGISAPLIARNSSLVGYLSGELGVSRFQSILPSSHHMFRVHSSRCHQAIQLVKIEHHPPIMPPTASRTMTPPFLYRSRVFCRLIL
ncbi:hypothetical protein EDD16DRAFT_1557485 [Pisolithus croceorrhizus]|nr:hypothetical protein EDD16DRAFT_1557485 [Pisolithus croceorrhizus]